MNEINPTIPKIIHYCWLSGDPIPEDLEKCMESWKEKLPDYEFMLWNFERFDKNSSAWVQQAFDNKKYAFAADYIRLYAVYNYGGIYMDMDIEVLKPFDDLLNQKIMIAYENPEQSGIEAGCFGAEKGDKFVGDCLSHYKNRNFIKSDGGFDTQTLPVIMESYLPQNPDVKPFGWHYFTNKSYKTGKVQPLESSYAIHHFAGSWLDNLQKELSSYIQKTLSKYGKSKKSSLLIVWFHFRKSLKYYGLRKGFVYWKNIIKNKKEKENG